MDILLFIVALIVGVVFFFGLLALFAYGLEKPYRTPCKEGGLMHAWSMPAFRLRVCDHCGRREFLMRAWEFDGYDYRDSHI